MKRSLVAGAVIALSLAACGELFNDATQCSTDDECDRFKAVCDKARGVCVARDATDDDDSGPDPSGDEDADPARPDVSTEEPAPDRCKAAGKETATVGTKIDGVARGEITGMVTLGCEKDWVLDSLVFVRAGATLKVEAGTTVKAKKGVGAGIVVQIGGRIVAEGTRDLPIVFTSEATPAAAGDWRGIYVLGAARPGGQPAYQGDPDLVWGGMNDADDSGAFSFVRIEYGKAGLTLAGAGSKTKIDFVQVRRPVESCFLFHGGRADAKHLVCQSPTDDQFAWWYGAAGRAQFLFGQRAAPPPTFNSGGILVDDSRPQIYNATICGDDKAQLRGYGVLYRDGATLNLQGAIVTGWFAGLDASGAMTIPGSVRGSVFFGNATNPAYAETPAQGNPDLPDYNDDFGLDENATFAGAVPANVTTNPGLVDCYDAKAPKPWPAGSLTTNAPTPPADGFFDGAARFIGAFKDASDTWMQGAWVRFDEN